MRAGEIGIDSEGSLKRRLRKVEIRRRIVLELVQESPRAPKPCPSGCDLGVAGDAHREQITRLLHRLDGLELSQLLCAQKCRVRRLIDSGLADHKNRESIAKLRHGLDGITPQYLSD